MTPDAGFASLANELLHSTHGRDYGGEMLKLSILLTAFLLAPGVSAAQVSASAVSFQNLPSKTYVGGSGARFYSENNRNFYFQAFGCEYEVQDPIVGSDASSVLSREIKKQLEGYQTGPVKMTFVSRLVNARRFSFSNYPDTTMRCDPNLISTIAILSVPDNDSFSFAIQILQTEFDPATGSSGDVFHNNFYMSRDLFTPRQTQEAWRATGEIGMAALKAWLSSPHRQ